MGESLFPKQRRFSIADVAVTLDVARSLDRTMAASIAESEEARTTVVEVGRSCCERWSLL